MKTKDDTNPYFAILVTSGVLSVEEKDKPENPDFIWYTIKVSDNTEIYFSPNSMEVYEAAMLWEQRQPNESM